MNDESITRRELLTADDCRSAALDLLKVTRRTLALFSRDLEPSIFGNVEFVTALQRLALRSRFTHIRIVVIDPSAAIRDGHRLVELARRLSSFIEFRRPGPDHANLSETFLVTDESGILYRPLASRYEGFVDTDNGLEARKYLKQFAEIWSQAEPEQEFRRLGL
ncbi:MAG TPA: acyltransferase [Gammaproteobacteria bacterium]|nr:acyltransferase [Gammaproteobacteria bacterium]